MVDLPNWEVSVTMVRGAGRSREERTFLAVLPAATEKAALRGGQDYGLGINTASEHEWKSAGRDTCVAARPFDGANLDGLTPEQAMRLAAVTADAIRDAERRGARDQLGPILADLRAKLGEEYVTDPIGYLENLELQLATLAGEAPE